MPSVPLPAAERPVDAVEVGRVHDAWGVKGWVRIHAHNLDAEALQAARRWYLEPPEGRYARGFDAFAGTVAVEVVEVKPHSDGWVAHFSEIPDRTAAEALKGARVLVSRTDFPAPADPDEFYWVDLIGLSVVNREGVALGVVTGLLPTGPHSVLCLEAREGDRTVERMIPFVSAYVDDVDRVARQIRVDWQPDY